MENLYGLIFNKLRHEVVSITKSLVEGLEEIFLFSMMHKVAMQLFAFSLVGFLALASFFWFDIPVSVELTNALLVTLSGVFIPASLILIVASRKRTITNAIGLEALLKRLVRENSFEDDLLRMIFEFLPKPTESKTELERFKSIEKSLEAVAEVFASIQQERPEKQGVDLIKDPEKFEGRKEDNNIIH